ncbi:MAG: DNA-binding protein [Deltaproteobacteria bacterium]|nr:DNA-binding protein [Deltaproteobacteria bacterium]
MKASQGRMGRVFVIRLEQDDVIPGCIEEFAQENGISCGHVLLIGGIGEGRVVVGPRDSEVRPPEPMLLPVDGAHEVVGIGVIAPDDQGRPGLHIHASLGRAGHTMTGCLRPGVRTWLVGEAILYEILDANVARLKDPDAGLNLLQVGKTT